MAAKLVCVVLVSSCLSLAEEEVLRRQYQKLRTIFTRRRLGDENGVSTENLQPTITTKKKGTKIQKSAEVDKLVTDLQSMKSKSSGNDAFLIKLLDNIDIGESRLGGKTSTTRRPDRFRPSTVREQIRKKVKYNQTTELPTAMKILSMNNSQGSVRTTPVVDPTTVTSDMRRERNRKTVLKNGSSNDKPSRFRMRRRKQNLHPRNILATSDTTVNLNTEVTRMEDGNEKEVNKINQPRKLSDLNDQTKIPMDSFENLKAAEKYEKDYSNHPVFKSFPMVESDRQIKIPNQDRKDSDLLENLQHYVYQSESLGHKSHTDCISMLSEIQEEQNFDLAALKSEMNAIKLNQQFFQSVPLKPAFMIEIESSQPLGKEQPEQQR